MKVFDLEFHHFGLAVRQADKALACLRALGYEINDRVYDPLQEVNLIFATHSHHPSIEVIYASEKKGPLDTLLQKGSALIYHLCYSTQDIQKTLAEFQVANIYPVEISKPKPAVLFKNRKVAFYVVPDFGMIELLEKN